MKSEFFSKLAGFLFSATVFLIIASLVISGATTVADFYDGLENSKPSQNENIYPGLEQNRPGDSTGETTGPTAGEATPPETIPEDIPSYVTNLSGVLGSGQIAGLITQRPEEMNSEMKELYDKLIESVSGEKNTDGYFLSQSGVYNKDNFVLVNAEAPKLDTFSVGKVTVQSPVKYKSSTNESILVKYVDTEKDVLALESYMGHIIVNAPDENPKLYDGNMNFLCEMEGITPAYARTYDGSPVYKTAKGKYCILSKNEDGVYSFAEISEQKVVYGLEYDYPAYFYKTPAGVSLYANYLSSKKVYVYRDAADEKQEISTQYTRIYNFGPTGLALAQPKNGTVRIIDYKGKNVHTAASGIFKYYPEGEGTGYSILVSRKYVLPYINDISSIGSGSVDANGWMRIRIQLIGQAAGIYSKVMADYETLVNQKGEFFSIPDGYTLEGYSDGVLLLSKGGLYGYYTIEGKWIANPIYTYASPFIQGLAVVGYENGTRGMIDTEGNIVLPFAYRHISNVSSGLILAYTETGEWQTYKLFEKEAPVEEPEEKPEEK